MSREIIPIILCGGSGTRLWPLSRELYPKQFLSLTGDNSLLQKTVLRVSGAQGMESPLMICNEEHRFLVAQQLEECGISPLSILLEPCVRSTAPAVALGAIKILQQNENAIVVVLSSDHVISSEQRFVDVLQSAVALAENDHLVTFGVKPTGPEICYGYIKKGDEINSGLNQVEGYKVNEFVEKPGLETARQYLQSRDYYWNSGMFVFKAINYLEELGKYRPDILIACQQAMAGESHDADFTRIDRSAFEKCPTDSIDYAVMEKTDTSAMVILDTGWSDVGSWSSLWDVQGKTSENNVTVGDVIVEKVRNSYIHSEHRLVAAVGVENLIIVETADAVLVADKEKSQEVKKIVDQLKSNGREEQVSHKKVFRPWGFYESLDAGEKFRVKRICVNPGASLSLQLHRHRAEHWVVVAGVAKVNNGDKEFLLKENESTYIPIGVKHRLENPGEIALEIIEVQSGAYLSEDDIVRFEDIYGRSDRFT